MEPETSFRRAEDDVRRVVAPTERRPSFCAEALTRRFRMGLLLTVLTSVLLLFVATFAMALSPEGLFDVSGVFGTLFVGTTLVFTFVVLLLFGALAGNNPRLTTHTRILWYLSFLVAGPVALPVYWAIHVWPVPYEPQHAPMQASPAST